jgi:23S rRNA pseudouridine2605 synthase
MRSRQDTHITEGLPGHRIAKIIARSGYCSRRDAEKLIAEGRVILNGKRLESPAINVTSQDKILIDGKPLASADEIKLWRYHKPKGRVTTHRDPQNRPTVFEALPPEMPRVISVGRLDLNTEGLLLLTNDGDLARHLEAPSTGWLRRYRVRVHGRVEESALNSLAKGIELDGIKYGPVEATLDRNQGSNAWLTLGLREGKNREVRKIMEHMGLEVNRLIRISFGPFQLGDLAIGAVDDIKRRVIAEQIGPALAEKLGLAEKRAGKAPLSDNPDTTGRASRRRPPQRRRNSGERPAK